MTKLKPQWTVDRPAEDGYYYLRDLHKHGDLTSIVRIRRFDRVIFRIGQMTTGETFNPYTMIRSVNPIDVPYSGEEE